MIWGSICHGIKEPMLMWDNNQWGKSGTGAKHCEHIITPHLYFFWYQLSSERPDYVFLPQFRASPHLSRTVTKQSRFYSIMSIDS